VERHYFSLLIAVLPPTECFSWHLMLLDTSCKFFKNNIWSLKTRLLFLQCDGSVLGILISSNWHWCHARVLQKECSWLVPTADCICRCLLYMSMTLGRVFEEPTYRVVPKGFEQTAFGPFRQRSATKKGSLTLLEMERIRSGLPVQRRHLTLLVSEKSTPHISLSQL
jgi:hypothetical protein